MTTILLIDLSSIAHPIWHTSQGSTNPNECSIQTVAKVRALASGQPHVAVACDSGRSFRRELDATYKANRPESDATLQHQIALAVETLKADGFPVWAVKGMEADDIIATATKMATHVVDEDNAVLIASSDKDLLQLVGPRVTVKKLTDGSEMDEGRVYVNYGVNPNQIRDYLSLVGDSSDNITGAPGIGPKKAAAMLTKYGTLEDLYAALDKDASQFQNGTVKSLTEFRPRMDTVRALVTLRTNVPLPFDEVFKPRVPADVAVFGGDDGMENMGGLGASGDGPAVVREQSAEVGAGRTDATRSSDSRGNWSLHEGAGAPVSGVRIGGPQEQAARVDDGVRQQPAASAVPHPSQGLMAHGAEVLPPPSGEFSMQLEPRSLREASLLAQEMFKSRLFSAYGTYQGVLSTILAGRELGMQAMASLRAFHIINGKPVMSADLIRALVLKSGQCEYFRCTARSNEAATWITKRKGDDEPISLSFTLADAKAAGLVKGGSGWEKNPADMCVARASAKLARLVYADIVFNMYAPEEFED